MRIRLEDCFSKISDSSGTVIRTNRMNESFLSFQSIFKRIKNNRNEILSADDSCLCYIHR